MKLKRKDFNPDGSGSVLLEAEETEDMWNAYNLIQTGDVVKTTTLRKVKKESSTGSVVKQDRLRINVALQIDQINFDPKEGSLRLSGRNVEENDFIKMGAFHTFDIEEHRPFTLYKSHWDDITLERLEEAVDVAKRADVRLVLALCHRGNTPIQLESSQPREVAALMIEEGVANLFLLTQSMTVLRSHIDTPIPRKRLGSQGGHDKALERFYGTVLEALVRNIDFDIVKCIIVAGPGFCKEAFQKFFMQQAVLQENKKLLENKNKLLIIPASSTHKHSLKEVLSDKKVLEQMADTKAAKEVLALNNFFAMLSAEPDRATYGLKGIRKANASNAIETLMISDELFRSNSIRTRETYVKLVQTVKENGGDVQIFSSMHVSGQRANPYFISRAELTQLTGVAAILRFPIPGLDDDSEEEDKDKKETSNSDEDDMDSIDDEEDDD